MNRFRSVPLAAGRAALRRAVPALWWRGRSRILLSGTEDHLPPVSLQHVDHPDRPVPGERAVGFGLQNDAAMRAWAARCGVRLALPDPVLTDELGDKSTLAALVGAKVPMARCTVVDVAEPADAGAVWDAFGGTALVVQRTPNNLTGTGTAKVHDVTELGSVLRSWAGQRLKVSEFIHGTDLTVSGCVGPTRTLLSGVSHQLVGIPELTPTWGAHCGNQLLDATDGWASAIGQCQRIAELVGDRLRERGFLGLFGLDLTLAEDGTVRLLELNPRIQSVTSLLNHVETNAALLPMPGAHLLALLGVEVPVVDVQVPRVPALSQLVVAAHEAHRVGAVPAEGRYRIDGTRTRLTDPECAGPPPAPDEVLVWRFAKPGDQVKADDRVFVAMFGRHVAPVGVRPALDGYATEVLRGLWQAADLADLDVSGRTVR